MPTQCPTPVPCEIDAELLRLGLPIEWPSESQPVGLEATWCVVDRAGQKTLAFDGWSELNAVSDLSGGK